MMNNGKILCCVDPSFFQGPISFYEFDYTDQSQSPYGSFAQVASPPNSGDFNANETMMLAMPDGTVLYTQVQQGTTAQTIMTRSIFIHLTVLRLPPVSQSSKASP